MQANKIQSALADVTAEQDPTVKSLKLASLCGALWQNAAWNSSWSAARPSSF
jgi:hypothetical protein